VSGERVAFYALRRGGWRDYVTLLHPPYTLWHLSYVAIGAALAPEWRPARLGAALAAFLLAMGIGAHALDELNGRPLRTAIPDSVLWGLAATSIAGGIAIGVAVAVISSLWLLAFVGFGGFIVVAYNLELFAGRFHTDAWFAISWGALPLLATYFAASERLRASAILAAAFAALLSLAQRRLSTPVRLVRRRVAAINGAIAIEDGSARRLTRNDLVRAPEEALLAMAGAVVLLAVALVVLRVE
jgi:hypothetical protein